VRERGAEQYRDPEYRARQAARSREWRKNPDNRARQREWLHKRQKDPEYREWQAARQRRWDLHRTYGITPADYNKMLAAQNGACAICHGSPGVRRLDVDHCHDTGEVRGLLCSACNTSLGKLNDDPMLLHLAAHYLLERTPQK
jgi:hypothetical protein